MNRIVRLRKEEKMFILSQLGEDYNYTEVRKNFNDKFGYPLTWPDKDFDALFTRKDSRELIETFRAAHHKSLEKMRYTHKANRLRAAEEIVDFGKTVGITEYIKVPLLDPDGRQDTDRDGNPLFTWQPKVAMHDAKAALGGLSLIKKEIEGDTRTLRVMGNIDLTKTTAHDIQSSYLPFEQNQAIDITEETRRLNEPRLPDLG